MSIEHLSFCSHCFCKVTTLQSSKEVSVRSKVVVGAALLVAAVVLIASYSSADEKQASTSQPLPASLDNLFPPKADSYVFLNNMRAMAGYVSGMICDVLENDIGNAQVNYQKFKEQYNKIPTLVPEWKDYFVPDPVNDLGNALKTGDPGQVMASVNIVDAVCQSCHLINMPKVHFKYHWTDFNAITMTDPVTGQDVPFKQYKQMLETSMMGVMNDLQQDQRDNARTQAAGFAARFASLNDACAACHDTERKYFVSADIKELVAAIPTALASDDVDMDKVGGLMEKIADDGCFKCHLVHVPAAFSKY
jgi:cytochrome c556